MSGKASVFVRIRPKNKMEKNYRSTGSEKCLADYDLYSITIGRGKMAPKIFNYPTLGKYPSYKFLYMKTHIKDSHSHV